MPEMELNWKPRKQAQQEREEQQHRNEERQIMLYDAAIWGAENYEGMYAGGCRAVVSILNNGKSVEHEPYEKLGWFVNKILDDFRDRK